MLCITLACDSCKSLQELSFEKHQKFTGYECPGCSNNGVTVVSLESTDLTSLRQLFSDHEARIHYLEQYIKALIEAHTDDDEDNGLFGDN